MASEPVVQDQRQRTLQALERRFEAAKAELDLHQNKNTKRFKTEPAGKKPHSSSSSAVDSSPKLPNPSTTPSKKGNFTFSGYVNSQDIDESGPTYAKLSSSIHENLLKASNDEDSGGKESKVDNVLHELLQSGDSALKYMQGSRSKRIDNWMLLDNYVQGRGGSGSRARGSQSNSKRSRKRMSMKQQKNNGLFDLPRELHSYEKFKPMHEMRKGYIAQLLKTTAKTHLAQSLLAADLHGAIISVVQCKVTSYTGVSGIMIRETAETFGIITENDKFRDYLAWGQTDFKKLGFLISNMIIGGFGAQVPPCFHRMLARWKHLMRHNREICYYIQTCCNESDLLDSTLFSYPTF